MSRNNSFPPIQKRSSNVTASDLSGEMTIDQFLSKYSQLSAPTKEENYVSRTPSPMAAARAASNLRRTSIRRLHSSKAGVRASLSPDDAASGGGWPLSRSEQALLLTERSAVLLDELPPTAESEESMSNGDSARSTDRSGWHAAKFQQSPSPDNRRGDKLTAPRRKSLLDRWEEVQGQERLAPRPGQPERTTRPSTGGSSTDSQFEDDAYPYRPRINTRGSSQETGFEPTPGDETAQRPHSGVDSLATPRSGTRPPSSSTEASSARSDVSDKATPAAPPGRSLFESGNVETIDDVIESLLTSHVSQTAKSRHASRGGSADSSWEWDQVDRSSHPVIETVHFPEPVKVASPPAVNEHERYERYGGQPRPVTSSSQVLERLSQVMSTQRTRGAVAQSADTPQSPGRESREETGSQRPPSGRGPVILRSPRARQLTVHKAPHAAPLTATFTRRAGHSATAAAGWHGPPKPPRLAVGRPKEPPAATGTSSKDYEGAPAAQATPGWTAADRADSGDGRHTSVFEVEPEGVEGWGGQPAVRVESPELGRPVRDAFCTVSPGWTKNRAIGADESDGMVDPTLTQQLMWRQILKWTAVSTSVLTGIAAVTLIVFLLL